MLLCKHYAPYFTVTSDILLAISNMKKVDFNCNGIKPADGNYKSERLTIMVQ